MRALFVVVIGLLAFVVGCESGQLGGADGAGGGASAGAPGQDAAMPRCQDRGTELSWQLTPAVATLSGMVVRKTIAVDGAEALSIVDAGGATHTLTLRAPTPMPLAAGERIDLRTAE